MYIDILCALCSRKSGKCFPVEVPHRREQTLLQLIERHILPGSHIVSDGWRSYANINRIHNGIYEHSVGVHQHNFVNPDNAKFTLRALRILGCAPSF